MATLSLIAEFLNTVDHRTFSRHGETHVAADHLTSPRALADWLADHDLPVPRAGLRPADVTATVALRTALRQVLTGESDGPAALAGYRLGLAPAPSGGLRIAARSGRPWLDAIVETVAHSAARGDWGRVKLCAAPDCRWAFHDTSRSGRGRWCAMEICGNRHKTRTYRERHHQAG
ncbi:CGNR zinc finger domain-containing protein [Jidongwangia harbinensis]|uniref:CGNR zinc finger domain-containing protein n=1 Tax=Jidongwangia harbinensis TaxID=2878561 RepID=UPI001CD9A4B9|nr:CGNR zinc finger domain-containing protein [Jidongwangia harbinensis]MCA2211501.1 CGNR zinc finger domain-containing protein [Jidongwangia harbinensis]